MNCNDCATADKREYRTQREAIADRACDELRIDGFRSFEQRAIVEEMEERALYPFGRP